MIIALHAKAGAGKDALADRLVVAHGFVKRGFATPLYEEVAHAFRVTPEWLADRSRKEVPQDELRLTRCYDSFFADCMANAGHSVSEPRSPRWLLQQWGTEYRRGQDLDYWLKRMAVFCKAAFDTGARGVAIIDTRFENEAQWVKDAGGHVIEIVRPGLKPVEGEHVSAKRLPQRFLDGTVHNIGTLADLYVAADELLENLHAAVPA